MAAGWLNATEVGDVLVLEAGGHWDVANVSRLDRLLNETAGVFRGLRFELGAVERLDTAGAWLIHRTLKRARAAGVPTDLADVSEAHRLMLEQVAASDQPVDMEPPRVNSVVRIVPHLGAATGGVARDAHQTVAFLGLVATTLARALLQPRRIRFTSLVYHLEHVGLNALPIVGLISFLVGVVLAYQG